MNKITKLLLGGAATTVLVFGVKKLMNLKSAGAALQFKILSLSIKGINRVEITIQVFNPTKTSIKIDSLSAEIFFNGSKIGVIQYFNTVPIAPMAYTEFKNILVELTTAGQIILVKQVISRTKSGGNFLVSGKYYINNIGIPFSQSYKAW